VRSLPEAPFAAALPLAGRRRRRATARGAARAVAFLVVTVVLLLLFTTVGALGPVLRNGIRRLWCRFCLRLLGLEVRYRGEPVSACATLFVANHVSYLDVVLLGARTDAVFVAKAEVAGWPLFGTIGRAAGTFFIRRRRRDALVQRNTLASRMRAGESVILFAEGTSTDGSDVLPLKTSLLSVAEPWILDRPIAVQPVTLAYRRLKDGSPFSASNCRRYAWFGDAELLPHLWAMLKDDGCLIEVVFGEPTVSWAVSSRKRLGSAMHAMLRQPLARPCATSAFPEPAAECRLEHKKKEA
jgi:lyso-ornithine lipid O-acyltransferase